MTNQPLPKEVTLKLSGDYVSSIIALLGKFPAEQVYPIMREIEKQCIEQSQPAP